MNYKEKIQLNSGNNILILVITIFLFFPSFVIAATSPSTAPETSPDAIALRVMPNTEHYSPVAWYQKNIKVKGSPQALVVDGYVAVRDGRTVYVNAANIDLTANRLYTNIYIISYNQNAENHTVDIFGQILVHWKFNINLSPAEKDKTVRDVQRLASLNDIKSALENYKNIHGNYPILNAGSYIANQTISVWPTSWQATLGKELAITMPLDPVNKLGPCGPSFDQTTCWDQQNKKFDGQIPGGLPGGSEVFAYTTDKNGAGYNLCANWETEFSINLAPNRCTQ